MIKKLTPIGNSLGLIIERPILSLLGIERNTSLEITTDGKTLTIQPILQDIPSGNTKAAMVDQEPASVKETGKSFLDELRGAFK